MICARGRDASPNPSNARAISGAVADASQLYGRGSRLREESHEMTSLCEVGAAISSLFDNLPLAERQKGARITAGLNELSDRVEAIELIVRALAKQSSLDPAVVQGYPTQRGTQIIPPTSLSQSVKAWVDRILQ